MSFGPPKIFSAKFNLEDPLNPLCLISESEASSLKGAWPVEGNCNLFGNAVGAVKGGIGEGKRSAVQSECLELRIGAGLSWE